MMYPQVDELRRACGPLLDFILWGNVHIEQLESHHGTK